MTDEAHAFATSPAITRGVKIAYGYLSVVTVVTPVDMNATKGINIAIACNTLIDEYIKYDNDSDSSNFLLITLYI